MVTLGDAARLRAATRALSTPSTRPTRWLLLVVVAGVLAMHGLGGGSHSAMSVGSPGHSAHAASAAGPETGMATVVTLAAEVGSPLHSVTVACLAVLGGLLLLLAAAAAYRRRPQAPLGSRGTSEEPRSARGPPRQRLLELCISRT